MSGSSMVPSTCEWLARICSTSVEPERGRPMTKIGSGAVAPVPRRSANKAGVKAPRAAAPSASFAAAE